MSRECGFGTAGSCCARAGSTAERCCNWGVESSNVRVEESSVESEYKAHCGEFKGVEFVSRKRCFGTVGGGSARTKLTRLLGVFGNR